MVSKLSCDLLSPASSMWMTPVPLAELTSSLRLCSAMEASRSPLRACSGRCQWVMEDFNKLTIYVYNYIYIQHHRWYFVVCRLAHFRSCIIIKNLNKESMPKIYYIELIYYCVAHGPHGSVTVVVLRKCWVVCWRSSPCDDAGWCCCLSLSR